MFRRLRKDIGSSTIRKALQYEFLLADLQEGL